MDWILVYSESEQAPLNGSLKNRLCGMLSVGCDRQTACHVLEITTRQLSHALQIDAAFRADVLRSEASPEFTHMRNIHTAGQDEKNWRASVWWLERRSPERFGKRKADALSRAEVEQAIEELTELLLQQADTPERQQDLRARLDETARQVEGRALDSNGES